MENDKMNIHQKMMYIKFDLLNCNINKSGYNKFGKFNYYELKDLLPHIIRLCKEYGCVTQFTFPTEREAELYLINADNPDEYLMTHMVRPPLEELPRMNIVQSEGSYQTYMRKYLILNMFDIVEPDVIDGMDIGGDNDKSKKVKTDANTQFAKSVVDNVKTEHKPKDKVSDKKTESKNKTVKGKPEVYDKIVEYMNENCPDKKINKGSLNSTSLKMFRSNLISKEERKEMFDYVKTL